MLKARVSLKEFEVEGFQAFVDTMTRAPGVKVNAMSPRLQLDNRQFEADFIAEVCHGEKRHVFVGEVKSNGQPRNAIAAIDHLKTLISRWGQDAHPVFIAPFLSKETRTLCAAEGASYIDLAGNVRVVADGLYIEREAPDNPFKERRELKSLFSPKSAQVLKILLRDPRRPWRVADLAAAARVSLGQVSNIRTALIDQDWAKVESDGLLLTKPDTLLDEWRDAYRGPSGTPLHYYTTLHGARLNDTILDVLAKDETPHAALSAYSAAEWLAPYARVGHQTLFADQEGLNRLTEALKLTATSTGGNIFITYLYDEVPFSDAIRVGPGLWSTSPVQTYLDLSVSGERGREGADFLRQELLAWSR